jgi:large subunit ribosomal protein L22
VAETETTVVRATAKYVRVSPRKARQVVDLIRGKSTQEAEAILMLTPRGASPLVQKVLKSAVANAENNHDMDAEALWVVNAWVDEGPTLKRFTPRAMGRATRIRKRTSHITVCVDEREE